MNRSRLFRLLPLVMVALLLTTACTGRTEPEEGAISGWPENEFTEKIVPPPSGEVAYTYDLSETMQYGVAVSGLTGEQIEAYENTLREAGFTASDQPEDAENTLVKDGTKVALSSSDGVLLIMIQLNATA